MGHVVRFPICALAAFCLVAGVVVAAQPPASRRNSDRPTCDTVHAASHVQSLVNQAHADCFTDDPFPSAKKCGRCHAEHYREWSVSPHAYAQISPVFNAMSNRLIQLTNGTLGDFCIRCHTPVGMALSEPINISQMDRPPSSREGVTCVVCHRINQSWGKISGRQALVPGDIHASNYGPTGSRILEMVLADPDKYGPLKTAPDPETQGRDVHRTIIPFFDLESSAYCGACHDVFAPNGFRLEDLFSEFKTSPAARVKHQACQDCHMGTVPGEASGYAHGPAAKVGNTWTPDRKRTNHMFVGPDYSVVHPGIFPHHPRAVREEHPDPRDQGLATMREWLEFDYRAGWGTPQFEDNLPRDYKFPAAWAIRSRRMEAREILNDQFQLLNEATSARHRLLSTGYRLGEVRVERADERGIRFKVCVYNGTDGHGVPTGFDAERLVYLRVTVTNGDGRVVFRSGDFDPNGDLRDEHSAYVHNGELPRDRYLFNLKSKFIVRHLRGGESDLVLNVPYSPDPLPYIRPETRPFTVLGRPLGARKQKQNLEVAGHRWGTYEVSACQMTGRGPYSAHIQLIAGMVPVNLVREIAPVGFDYNMSPREVADGVLAGHLVLHERYVPLECGRAATVGANDGDFLRFLK